MTDHDPHAAMRLFEAAFRSTGRGIIPMSSVGRPARRTRFRRTIATDSHAIIGLDLTLDIHGQVRLIEANGSNMGATSLGDPDGDRLRAEHQVEAARPRLMAEDCGAILVAYSQGTGLVAEIMARGLMIHDLVSHRRHCQVGDTDLDPSAPYVVVVDTVERIARHITLKVGRLCYRDRPVVSPGNCNLLPALVRKGVIERRGTDYAVDYSVFHDGRLAPLVHDKGTQQEIARGTGVVPMRWRSCQTFDEVVQAVLSFLRDGLPAIIKPNATSGGSGIDFFGPGSSEIQIRATLDHLIDRVSAKYGPQADKSIWPVRVFEFVQSTPYPVDGAGHLWDMRVCCLIRPGEVEMTVCGLRVCPESFVPGQYSRSTACSNTTGRRPSTERVYSPLADMGRPTRLMLAAGVDVGEFERILDASAAWCEAAWTHSSTRDNRLCLPEKNYGSGKSTFAT